jgi:uncharacterized membrane protein HdeD (DUF308 family)
MLVFGWLLVLACGTEVAQAILVGYWAEFFHHLLAAILFGVVGGLLVGRPLLSAQALTIVMAAFFMVGGLLGASAMFPVSSDDRHSSSVFKSPRALGFYWASSPKRLKRTIRRGLSTRPSTTLADC